MNGPTALPWVFIVNVTAGGGRAGRQLVRWQSRILAHIPAARFLFETTQMGAAARVESLVRDAGDGPLYLAGVGGDGTHHHLINTLAKAQGLEQSVYAPLSLGSGNDWVRSLGIPRRLTSWLRMLTGATVQEWPLALIEYRDARTGARAQRYFINVAGMAYDAEVVRRAASARLRHRLLYPLQTLRYLSGYRAPRVRTQLNGKCFEGTVHTINVGLGKYSGGGMQLTPHAGKRPGQLALTLAERLANYRVVLNGWRFYHGSIDRVAGVHTDYVQELRVEATAGQLEVEADGEWLGYGPVMVRMTQQRLWVITEPGR